jgi:hypothetical protein
MKTFALIPLTFLALAASFTIDSTAVNSVVNVNAWVTSPANAEETDHAKDDYDQEQKDAREGRRD